MRKVINFKKEEKKTTNAFDQEYILYMMDLFVTLRVINQHELM